jgi:hypothetical protein
MKRIAINLRIYLLAAVLAVLDALSTRLHASHPLGMWATATGDRLWGRLIRARIARLPTRPALGQINRT